MNKNKKKVLICYHSAQPGGVEKHILDIIVGLSKDYDIAIACPSGPLVNDYLKAGCKEHINLYPRFEADFKYVYKVYKYVKVNNIDIIHSHELRTGALATFAGWLARIPKRIYHVHTPFSEWKYGRLKKYPAIIVNTFVNAIVGNIFATDVIALTNTIKNVRVKKEFILPKKIRVIPNGVDVNKYRSLPISGEEFRKENDIDSNTFLVGNISRFTKEKGHAYFVRAFSRLLKDDEIEGLDVKLLLAGGGVLLNDVKELSKKLDVYNKIIFTGRFEERNKIRILNAMDLFVFPTYAEGFGIVLLEAMACGLPVLSSDLPVLKDVGDEAIDYFKAGDERDLHNKMKQLILNKSRRTKLSKMSAEKVSLYSMERFWGYYKKLYE